VVSEDEDVMCVRANARAADFICEPSRALAREQGQPAEHRRLRALWLWAGRPMFRMTFHNWYGVRRRLLGLFGARVHPTARIRPSAIISHPWNLTVGEVSTIGDDAVIFCPVPISIGAHCTVSQYSVLTSAGFDYRRPDLPLVAAPIRLCDGVWVAADAHVGPGVTVGRDTVIGSRSTVLDDVEARSICAGDEGKRVGARMIRPIARHRRSRLI
jgi:putative colanic acid biosynthesis acetyltransferase WcaF